jgi:hypothetical protein
MQVQFDAGATRWRRRVSACVGLLAFALVLAAAGTGAAQSVLGSIRGTVTDAGGGVIPKAPVLITDEGTGLPRTVDTDARGVFEVGNLQPGTYRVEIIVTNFKKFERAGVIVRTGQVALLNVVLEIGPMGETVNVTAAAPANVITLDSPAVTKGIDDQQLRDLPRSSRDIQSFLYLNPNVAGTTEDIQFLGGRTYGVSYIQDGQASTNAIFGTVGNSAPGLDAIQEMQVLSNSYSAEYGGLAGVVVTTKRGGQKYHGSAFYDFNSNALNELTYGQKLTGVSRSDPNADTKQQRYGGSVGGPIARRTFFYANYEGLRDKSIQGGGTTIVPGAALRAGDFSASTIRITDPLTGQPFPGNVIPASRISPIAKNVMNYFWPLPTRDMQANGMGTFQQYVPESRMRERFDLRMDHEAGTNNQFFARGSYQYRNPTRFIFQNSDVLTNLPLLDSSMTTYAAVGGWTSILTNRIVNEMRVGYNYDSSGQVSTLKATAVAAQLGLEAAPSVGADVPGFPTFNFTGSNRPGNITDGRNNNRMIQQNSFSIADNLSWMKGDHSLRGGALLSRNSAIDGFGRGLNHRGTYRFGPNNTGNAFADFLLGLPNRATEQVSTRGDLDGHSTDFATFIQDDWRVNKNLTLFLGLRYELAGPWHEKNLMLANFQAIDGGYHVVANKQVWSLLPYGLSNSESPWYSHVKLASDLGLPNTLVKTDKNNFSPRVGYAYRADSQGKTVLRGGFGLFHPTTAVQGIRDQLAANEFRYSINRTPGPFAHAFSQGTGLPGNDDFGTQGVWPDIQSPDIYQYNFTVERELPWEMGVRASYLGSTMRKLLVNREYNSVPASTVDLYNYNPDDNARRPFPMYGAWMNMIENTGSGQFHAGQFELTKRFKKGFAFDVAYTYAHSTSNAPDSGNSSLGVLQYDPYNLEADRGPDPFVVKHRVLVNATVDVPFGKDRSFATSMPAWAETLFGGWTVSAIFQARSGANLTPYFTLSSSFTPYNIGFSPDTTGVWTGDSYRPNQIGDPKANVPTGMFFNPAAYEMPAPGVFPGNTKRNSLVGPGNWIVNLAFYKDIISRGNLKMQFTCTLDNAFNHPQFFPGPGSDVLDMTNYLVDGDMNNGTTGVLGSTAEANVEGFALARQIRIGLRARF